MDANTATERAEMLRQIQTLRLQLWDAQQMCDVLRRLAESHEQERGRLCAQLSAWKRGASTGRTPRIVNG